MQLILSGVNIQYPISRLLLQGLKTVETRTYPLPKKYVLEDMLLIETPGREAAFSARAVAVIRFGPSFRYLSPESFAADYHRHRVEAGSPWAWKTEKWGWPIDRLTILSSEIPIMARRGIVFTQRLVVDVPGLPSSNPDEFTKRTSLDSER